MQRWEFDGSRAFSGVRKHCMMYEVCHLYSCTIKLEADDELLIIHR